jgi:hypothetical protein
MPFSFDAYEYVGYIAPGAVFLLGLAFIFPAVRKLLGKPRSALSELGIFIVAAFVLGHLLHGLGHYVIDSPKSPVGRMHATFSVIPEEQELLSATERTELREVVNSRLCVDLTKIKLFDQEQSLSWDHVARQIYMEVYLAKRNERVDIFNRGYGLHLALAIAFILMAFVLIGIAILSVAHTKFGYRCVGQLSSIIVLRNRLAWDRFVIILAALLLLSTVALQRMSYFDKLYAGDLFLAYLSMPHPTPGLPCPR